jgi:hypothetical protein
MRSRLIGTAAAAALALTAAMSTSAGADTVVAIHTGDHTIDSGASREDHTGGHAGAPVCRYEPLAIPPSKPTWYADRHHIPVDDGTGSWFLKLCGANLGGVVYISRTDPAELLAAARQRLVLQTPVVRFSPATVQVVQIPTWMWIDAASWQPQSSNVAVPGVSVSVRAWPVASEWTMGDGTTVRCAGPGTPFDPHHDDPARGSSCSHTYTTSSSSAPAGAFDGSVTVTWRASATVTGAAGGGDLPALARTRRFTVRVAQVQVLNRAATVR